MGQQVNTSTRRGFPYREIAIRNFNVLVFQTSSTEVPIPDLMPPGLHSLLGSHAATSPKYFTDPRSMIQVSLLAENPERRTPRC
jgi:hypothetical protein